MEHQTQDPKRPEFQEKSNIVKERVKNIDEFLEENYKFLIELFLKIYFWYLKGVFKVLDDEIKEFVVRFFLNFIAFSPWKSCGQREDFECFLRIPSDFEQK